MQFVPSAPSTELLAPRTELDEVDDALARVPVVHLQARLGLRQLRRGHTLICDGRAFPTVMATFSAGASTARLFQPAFASASWLTWPGEAAATAIVHTLVGCGLAHDERLYAGFARAVGRRLDEIPAVLLLERGGLDRVVGRDDAGRATLHFERLPPGLDFAVAYAAYLNQGELLRRRPALHAFFAHLAVAPARRRPSTGAKVLAVDVMARH